MKLRNNAHVIRVCTYDLVNVSIDDASISYALVMLPKFLVLSTSNS